ncbi:MAG: nucleotidyl transferase AbiEii/AbiGii toxin family protein [Armatimonadota bacterium]
MYRLLTNILRDSYLPAVLGFKGGTACYFFYGLPRFSVDLDFDIITKKEDVNLISQEIYTRINSIISNEGFEIKDASLKLNTIFFLVSYEKEYQNIKIEISQRNFLNKYEIKDFFGLSVKTMIKADLFAHKLVAATDRKNMASRDFYDIYFFFKQSWPINEDIIKLRTGKSLKNYLSELEKFIKENLLNKNILQGMGELLNETEKIWVKNNLKAELLRIITFYRDSNF